MCTAFIHRGEDVVFGYSLDIDPAAWNYKLIKRKDLFTVAITVGSTTYYTHGVNAAGHFGNLPYMNGEDRGGVHPGRGRYRIDLLVDRYIRGRLSYEDALKIVESRAMLSGPGASFHALLGDGEGHMLLVEPSYGYREPEGDYACAANFPLLACLEDYSNPFYGKDRYDTAERILAEAGADFGIEDGLRLLERVKQEGQWGTRLSFVYSRNENAVYYCENGNFDAVERWSLQKSY